MTSIDAKEAASALSDIDDISHLVRQSRIYDLASQIMIMWGVLIVGGNLATWDLPRYGGSIWIGINALGVLGSTGLSMFGNRPTGVRRFVQRRLAAFLLFFAFGFFCSCTLGHFGPRQMETFWPIYFMLFYVLAGLWVGHAFVVIGLCITALTLIGYFFVEGPAFPLWMAVTNGGGLILGGLWMRRD
jgi:hypothetical protein